MSIKARIAREALTKEALAHAIARFIKEGTEIMVPSNAWLRSYGSEIYVRSYRPPKPASSWWLDIANFTIREDIRSQGVFTHILEAAEKEAYRLGYEAIRIENLLPTPSQNRLIHFFARRGYIIVRSALENLPCMVLTLDNARPTLLSSPTFNNLPTRRRRRDTFDPRS